MFSRLRIRCTACKEGNPPKSCDSEECYMHALRFSKRKIPVAAEMKRRYNTRKEGDKP